METNLRSFANASFKVFMLYWKECSTLLIFSCALHKKIYQKCQDLPFLRLQKSIEINILFICVKWCERAIKSLTITEFQLTKSARHKWIWFHWFLGTSPGNFSDRFGYTGETPAIWFSERSEFNAKNSIIFFNVFQTLPSVWFVHGQYYCLLKEICPSKTMHLRWKLSLSVHQNCSTDKVKTSTLD